MHSIACTDLICFSQSLIVLQSCFLTVIRLMRMHQFFSTVSTVSCLKRAQQGDPLGPLLFCNTIQPLLMSLGSVLRLGYMDDVTLGGSQDAVAKDVQTVMEVGHEVRLDLNTSKCELISRPGCAVTDPILQCHFCRFQCQLQTC